MTDQTQDPLIDLSIFIEASPETVWGILSDPRRFSRWMEGEVTFETEVGSAFEAAFPAFQTIVRGEIVSFEPDDRRIAFTWGVGSGPQADSFPVGSSLVAFEVQPEEGGARVSLRHSTLPSAQEAQQHETGWRFHLSRLALFANRRDLGEALERTLEAWFAAWNEPDGTERRRRLEACCAEDVVFRDDYAETRGIDRLHLHIGNTLRFIPGWRLEADGPPRVCRGEALVDWRGIGSTGGAISGTNHLRAGADGRLQRVTGFTRA